MKTERKPGEPKAKWVTRLKKECDAIWSKLVRFRDEACQVCGVDRAEKTLFAHHWYLPKTYSLRFRWLVDNGVAVCYACHKFKIHLLATYAHLGPMFRKMEENGRVATLSEKAKLYDSTKERQLSQDPDYILKQYEVLSKKLEEGDYT